MALRHGRSFEELRRRGTLDLLRALPRCGLIDAADARELEDGYRFLSNLENRLRIESDQPAWALPTALPELARIARRMGYDGADGAARLLAELQQRRERIRAIFDRGFAAEQR
jgi:[glutamine synthetase] adenylyltransferase / [glutamine synthetase]-adenylyl-L-tyrosine phosphorylase